MDKHFIPQKRMVGKGLYYLFIAEVCSFLSVLPVAGPAIAVASSMIAIYALYIMSKADIDYRFPFLLTIGNMVLSLSYSYVMMSGLSQTAGTLLQCAIYAVRLVMVYFICTRTTKYFKNMDAVLLERTSMVWKIFLFSNLLEIARALLATAPATLFTSELMDLISICVSIFASVMFLMFLWKSQRILQK